MVKIKKQFVSSSLTQKVSYAVKNLKNFIIIHETGNRNKGADAQAHANIQTRGNERDASWHWSVDEFIAIQSFSHDVSCWAAGDYKGNTQGIQIEMCVNSDGNYMRTLYNTIDLVQMIMEQEKISIQGLKTHNEFSGKNCPTNLLGGKHGMNWSQFVGNVRTYHAPKPSPSTGEIGIVEVLATHLNLREKPELGSKVLKVLNKGEKYKCNHKDGKWYRLGNGWASAGSDGKLLKFVPHPKPTPKPAPKKGLFKVQTGAFAEEKNAKRLADELRKKGFPTYIIKD